MRVLAPNELRIICTGRGEHTSIEMALLMADPGDRDPGLLPGEPPPGRLQGEGGRLPGEPKRFGESMGGFWVVQTGRTRRTRAGIERPNGAKGDVVKHSRADGGETIEFPACPRCKGRPRLIRDDNLAAFMRAAPGQPLDVSLIP